MNYIRGAISTISAPYQYYKDINPSTLTGAIDVIVVHRLSPEGETTLHCTPFHVRFGKWQVLRPSERAVTVLVNGKPIPFLMKIGEAGEAFFVFETDADDVPDDLITSPVLRPMNQQDQDRQKDSQVEFLDLNAQPTSGHDLETSSADAKLPLPSPPVDNDLDGAVDAAVREAAKQVKVPEVIHVAGVELDASGYHSAPQHNRDDSVKTVTGSQDGQNPTPIASRSLSPSLPSLPQAAAVPFPSRHSSNPRNAQTDQEYSWEWGAFPIPSPAKTRFPTSSSRSEPLSEQDGSSTDGESSIGIREDRVRAKSAPPEGEDSTYSSPHPGTFLGTGGSLSADSSDPAQLAVRIEGRSLPFELSLPTSPFSLRDPLLAASSFESARVPLRKLLDDPKVLDDPNLVIRWAGDRYITKGDGSPLMEALVGWREASLLAEKRNGKPSMLSPDVPKPIKASAWSKWWSRADSNNLRPGLVRGTASVPNQVGRARSEEPQLQPRDIVKPPPSTISTPPLHNTPSPEPSKKIFAKTLRLTSDQLKALDLKAGSNTITFSLSTTGAIACTAKIFVWESTDLVVVSDIDGTITKSDGLGHLFTMIGRDWTHLGVAKLYTDITRNGYKIMYLTSRAIGQADATRDYLKGISQGNYQLPEGPVIMSPDRLMAALHREVVMRKPELFKMACLRDIHRLFGTTQRNPFYAGFGNRITDALSYRSVDVPSGKIFTIDSRGEVKMELLELSGYTSSYIHMTDLVDQMFPPIHKQWAPAYTDFSYWRVPVQEFPLPDLAPPSPALSAKSDASMRSTGTLARLRQFSLGRTNGVNAVNAVKTAANNASTLAPKTLPVPIVAGNRDERSTHHRQVSSFERFSGALAGFARRSVSPSTSGADSGGEEDEEYDLEGRGAGLRERKRGRRGSVTSMPGSLDDDLQFGMDEEEEREIRFEWHLDGKSGEGAAAKAEDYEGEYDGEGEDEELEEDTLFDDLYAAGEMKKVPFL